MKRILLIVLLAATSCSKAILGTEPDGNNPVDVFETLWENFDKNYALFEVKGIDWNNLHDVYRAKVTPEISQDSLWTVCASLIENLNDSHVSITDINKNRSYISGYKLNQESAELFIVPIVLMHLQEAVQYSPDIFCGQLRDRNIGYIHISRMENFNTDYIDIAMRKVMQYDAVILDLRQNSGGDPAYSQRISGWFADNEDVVLSYQYKNGPGHNDFTSKTWINNRKYGSEQYLKPTVVLTDRATISAAEWLLISLKTFKHVVQIGDTTAGDFSMVGTKQFLPNGWYYTRSTQKVLLPDGRSLEGIGHIPDILVVNSLPELIDTNTDSVILRALQYLSDEHGI